MIDPYLAARMDERGTHVVILIVSQDLLKRNYMTPRKRSRQPTNLRTVFQATSPSR